VSVLHSEPWPRACVQVYTGDGKGKTTAAFGLALRAVGRGLRVWVGQFMKGVPYGELAAATSLGDQLVVEQFGSPHCIPWAERPHPDDVALAVAGLARSQQVLHSGDFQVVVLDEVAVAVHFRLLAEQALLELVDARPPRVELVCTGRYATPALLDRADLVTVMRDERHPYRDHGLLARDGIER